MRGEGKRALDLFCCAGGASMGLYRAGFDVVGVDIKPQPRYPFTFVQADALNPPFNLSDFDFIWASPPCQDYSALKGLSAHKRGKMIPAVREMLEASGKPYAIENVVGSELKEPIRLCGSSFGLGIWRHRLFETSPQILFSPPCNHSLCPKPIDVTGLGGPLHGQRKKAGGGISRKPNNLEHAREVMGIDWMSRPELSQSIPPAYSEFIARHFLNQEQSQ
ncbi:MAG: DNA cytosine methyltransferase [Candidatus Binatia bacterium]